MFATCHRIVQTPMNRVTNTKIPGTLFTAAVTKQPRAPPEKQREARASEFTDE